MATETVTVKAVGQGNPWEHGITYWDVTFDRNGQDFNCVWGKKGEEPEIGDQVEGEFFKKGDEWRFRKASGDFQGGSQGGGSSGGSSNGKSDSTQGEIAAQWAVGRANEQFVAGLIERDQIEPVARDLLSTRDKVAAGVAAGGRNSQEPQRDTPPTGSASGNPDGPSDKQKEFLDRLVGQHCDPYQQTLIHGFTATFDKAAASKAIEGLKEEGTRGSTAVRLAEAAKEWGGTQSDLPEPEPEPVGAKSDEDGVPF